MKRWQINACLLLCLTSTTSAAKDSSTSCLQAPSRVAACPNMIYRSVMDTSTKKNKMICFCKRDFDLLLNKDVSNKQAILNRMELTQLLSENGLTKQQLVKMVSR